MGHPVREIINFVFIPVWKLSRWGTGMTKVVAQRKRRTSTFHTQNPLWIDARTPTLERPQFVIEMTSSTLLRIQSWDHTYRVASSEDGRLRHWSTASSSQKRMSALICCTNNCMPPTRWYRVFIKYCVFFWTLPVLLQRWCSTCLLQGKTEKSRVRNILKSMKKHNI